MHDEAERSVIGAMLVNNSIVPKVTLTSEMFINTNLSVIYEAIQGCVAENAPADLITVGNRIPEDRIAHDLLNKILTDCVMMVPSSVNWKHYEEDVIRSYVARKSRGIFNDADGSNVSDKISEYMQLIETTTRRSDDGTEVKDAVKEFSEGRFKHGRPQGIHLGYEDLDDTLGGLYGGDMCVIAARPSVGKSAFSTEVALNMAKAGFKVDIFNLEMTVEQVYERQIAHESGIELSRIRHATCFLSHHEEEFFQKGNEALAKLPIKIYDSVRKVSKMLDHAAEDKADVVIIDYMQLITPESIYKGQRAAEVGQISHAIKQGAKKLKIPIIVLAQINRESAKAKTKEPTMAELREAGDIEQDADQVILLWNVDDSREIKGIKVDKNRQGECGSGLLRFDGAVMQFTETDDVEGCPFD